MSREDRRDHFALSLLFTAVIFCILLVTLLIAAALAYLLMRLGLLTGFGIPKEGGGYLLLFVVLISVMTGLLVSALTTRFPMRPITKMIDQLNRLAAGDFQARLEFSGPLKRHSSFARLSESFNTMAQELENTEMLRGDFINNFSHEFKTPIVSIAGFAKLLRRGNLSEAQTEEYLAIIEEESLRLSEMATNVLNLTRIENQTILTDISTYNLSEQLRACVLLLEERWSRKQLSLDLEFGEYEVSANEELLKQVWINLLDNAVKFSPPTGEVVVRIQEAAAGVQVFITNFGSEIPAEKRDRIFDKFYQADESHASQGNGVGLAIVKRVVELHRGTVQAESSEGKTTFTVTLPHPVSGCKA